MWSPSAPAVVLFAAGWCCGWFLLWRPRRLAPARSPRRPIAIVVPARDEEASLPTLLAGLVAQLGAGDELLVVDDGSTDRTAAIAAGAGAAVLTAGPRPAGWTGKAWAAAGGAGRTSAPTLVFLDADVTVDAPDLLDRVAAAVDARPDALVSVQPWHRTVRPVEQLSVVFNLLAVMGSGAFTPLGPAAAGRVAFGPVLACTRAAYEAGGGHAHPDVRGAVAEDIALARRFDRVELFTGRPDVSFRMYPGGLGPLVQGWTKNVATGARRAPWWAVALAIAWLWSLAGGWLTSAWFYLATVTQLAVLGRRVGRFGLLTALAYPVAVLGFLVVFVRSVALTALARPVRWKGRSVPSRPRRRSRQRRQ